MTEEDSRKSQPYKENLKKFNFVYLSIIKVKGFYRWAMGYFTWNSKESCLT